MYVHDLLKNLYRTLFWRQNYCRTMQHKNISIMLGAQIYGAERREGDTFHRKGVYASCTERTI